MADASVNSNQSRPAQDFVPIEEIRDGVIILKDGGLRMALMVSSLNFALKSADEQQAIILQYQNFLNSLDFHVQFFIQSRKLDIRPYLHTLEDLEKNQLQELIKIQTREYIEFIRQFAESTNIMAKTFFVIVPYSPPLISQNKGWLGRLFGGRKKEVNETAAEATASDFALRRSQLEQRVGVVEQGLARMGLRTVPLGTEELVELFFKIFNPGETEAPSLAA